MTPDLSHQELGGKDGRNRSQPRHSHDKLVPGRIVFPAKSDSAQWIQVSPLPFFKGTTVGNGIRVEVQRSGDIENEAPEQLRPRIQEHSIIHGLHPLVVS